MPHALLLSPDDQAVSAITGVLEEMSVSCERPLDGVTAAQKLNSQDFDLVLVDCENLPAAKLIFDVCRRGRSGNHPVPIAIVDGRAGLPTAFRLGAELILTKPVAKDQARTTIRTAVGRVRKDLPANETATQGAKATESAERGWEESASNSQSLTSAKELDSAGRFSSAAVMTEPSTETLAGPSASAAMHSSPDGNSLNGIVYTAIAPQENSAASVSDPSVWSDLSSNGPDLSADSSSGDLPSANLSSRSTGTVNSKLARVVKMSDDPVLAEIDRTELEQSNHAKSNGGAVEPVTATPSSSKSNRSAGKSMGRESSYRQGPSQSRGLVALLMLVIAGGGFYAAWTYQPGFREMVQPQFARLREFALKVAPAAPDEPPAKPSPRVTPAATAVAASPSPSVADQNPATDTDSATANGAQASAATTESTATHPASAATSASPTPTPPAVQSSAPPAVALQNTSTNTNPPASGKLSNPNDKQSPLKQTGVVSKVGTPSSSDAPLPGEKSAVILSSKGAEKRLAHSVLPEYPTDSQSADEHGTVVLKTLIDEDGKVDGVRLVEGNAVLATAAMQAVRQWRYRPYVRDGKALPFQTVVIIDFQKP